MLSPIESMITHLTHSQIHDPLQRSAALAANQRMAIAAHQRVGGWLGAGGGSRIRRTARIRPYRFAPHFAAAIESTCIVLVFASSVPVTFTFLAANFSGVFWSLSV